MQIEKAGGIGFCFGVKRAINMLEQVVRERGSVETLGAVVHNQQVLQRLAEMGIKIAKSVDEIQGDTVVISSHGISPQLEQEIRARRINIINTTCPFVHRAQVAAKRLARSGFFVIIYGDAEHPEVKGILGWADGNGVATLDDKFITRVGSLPRRLGILSQTTQVASHFTESVKKLIDSTFTRDSELRIVDTICHDIRKRQEAALALAKNVDLMLVIGGHNSANTSHLAELCSTAAETYRIETAVEIQPFWLKGRNSIGITAGASTGEQTITEVMAKLKAMTSNCN